MRISDMWRLVVSASIWGFLFPASAANLPVRVTNDMKYRETSKPDIKKDGDWALSVRALLNRDGSADLDVTSGVLDDRTTAVGSIKRVQVTGLDKTGADRYRQRFEDLPPYATLHLLNLWRGQHLRVDAQFRDAAGRPSPSMAAATVVKKRPFLALSSLRSPDEVLINTDVNVNVFAQERNGDVGARANAVLYIDGVEADRINGLWVDAAGLVDAQFTCRFRSVGQHTIQVGLERDSITPGDWTDTDKIVAKTVSAVPDTASLDYSVAVTDMQFRSHSLWKAWYADGSPDITVTAASPDWMGADDRTGRQQQASFYATLHERISLPVRIAVEEYMSSTSQPQFTMATLITGFDGPPESDGIVTSNSASVWDETTGGFAYITTYESLTNGFDPYTIVQYWRSSGEVIYYSTGYAKTWLGDLSGSYTYSWNTSGIYQFGLSQEFGAQYAMKIALSTPGPRFSVDATITQFVPFTSDVQDPYACAWILAGQSATGPEWMYYCSEFSLNTIGRTGSTFGKAWQQ